MNVLILNASPRPTGLVSQMLEAMASEARQRGAQVEQVAVCSLSVRPCTACMSCRSSHKCALPEDDAQRTLARIQAADALIVGSPCYWGNMNGQLKVLFDRIVYGMMGENSWAIPQPLHRGKRALIVASCSTMWPFNIWFNQTRGVKRAVAEVLRWSGFKVKGVMQKPDTLRHPQLTEKDLRRCRKLVNRLF